MSSTLVKKLPQISDDSRKEIFLDIFGREGILRTCSNEDDFKAKKDAFLEKHFASLRTNYKFMPIFLNRLLK